MIIKYEEVKKIIEKHIAEGIIAGEEADVTTDHILKDIWPLMQHLNDRNLTTDLNFPNMKMHERMEISPGINVMKVHKGWIYDIVNTMTKKSELIFISE